MREYKKLKELSDYSCLDAPEIVSRGSEPLLLYAKPDLHILRMLIRPKYGDFKVPEDLGFLKETINFFSNYDRCRTGIKDSWCYVTIRRGAVTSKTDDAFHFDGSSFRTDIIPERNYIWCDHKPTEYKTGRLDFPSDFDPVRHNLFTFAENQLAKISVKTCNAGAWYLLSPFCLHRRPFLPKGTVRTFIRICFTDIEGRDINNSPNALLDTPFYGRDPVRTFRDKLVDYQEMV